MTSLAVFREESDRGIMTVISENPILAVDLDGSLLSSDSLWETFWNMLRHSPWRILRIPFWLLKGKDAVKAEVSESFDPSQVVYWPYNQAVLADVRLVVQCPSQLLA